MVSAFSHDRVEVLGLKAMEFVLIGTLSNRLHWGGADGVNVGDSRAVRLVRTFGSTCVAVSSAV
jgi:hypothetical protein